MATSCSHKILILSTRKASLYKLDIVYAIKITFMVRKSIKIAFMYLHNQNVGKDLIVLNPCKDGLATPRLGL